MNALQSYSSDDESGNEAPTHKSSKSGDPGTNYDEVGMDISEDSDDDARSKKSSDANQPPSGAPHHGTALPTSTDGQKNQNDTKEGQRSSLQERLLGIASGGRRPSQDERSSVTSRRESRTSPSRNRADHNHRKSKSKSPKAKSPRPRSPGSGGGSTKNSHKTKSRSKSRERDVGRSSRNHSSREQSSQGHSGRNRDSRETRRGGRDDDRKRRDEERRGRRSRSRSRSRERRRSRSRSRDRRSRSRSRERRRRSRSHERKRPMDVRKAEAQQKLAALKAANPDLTAAELMRRSMEAQMEEVKKQTGIALPSYYNPATMNPLKFAEQERKKKLLWGNKSKPAGEVGIALPAGIPTPGVSSLYGSLAPPVERPPPIGVAPANLSMGVGRGNPTGGQASLWASTKFVNDKDGKMAEKFRRLMGVKHNSNTPGPNSGSSTSTSAPPPPISNTSNKGVDLLQKQETMFTSMERQYEMARLATHTHKGFGLGFTSQSFMPK